MHSVMKPEFSCGVERRRAGRFQRHSVQNVAPRERHPASISHVDLPLHNSVTRATSETYTTATIRIISVQYR